MIKVCFENVNMFPGVVRSFSCFLWYVLVAVLLHFERLLFVLEKVSLERVHEKVSRRNQIFVCFSVSGTWFFFF